MVVPMVKRKRNQWKGRLATWALLNSVDEEICLINVVLVACKGRNVVDVCNVSPSNLIGFFKAIAELNFISSRFLPR